MPTRKRELPGEIEDPVDFLLPEEHEAQDEDVMAFFPLLRDSLDDVNHADHVKYLCLLVHQVSVEANTSRPAQMKSGRKEIATILEQNSDIQDIVRQAAKDKKFRAIRMLPEFRIYKKLRILDPASANMGDKATELSWTEEYVGAAWKMLEGKIHKVIKEDEIHGENKKKYARLFTLVQSSGMGKSRLIDEYSKHHVVIPLCLRSDDETGFPRPDSEVRDFLCRAQDHDSSLRAAHAFLFALFQIADRWFNDIDVHTTGPTLAEKFRDLMNDPGRRTAFYDDVITKASGVDAKIIVAENMDPKDIAQASSPPTQKGLTVVDAAKTLIKTLQRLVPQSDKFGATLLLSFDEAHTLTTPLRLMRNWSPHFSVRSALRSLRKESIFSVFLSTTGRFSGFVPAAKNDPSSYDLMAKDFVIQGQQPLSYYTSIESMSRFGRPLFYTRYKCGDTEIKNSLLGFAKQKIRGGNDDMTAPITSSEILALLSIRIPLEFNATTLDGQREGFTQVHKHMRLAIAVSDDNETCETVQPAEPLLAEAAFDIIKDKKIDQAEELLQVLGGPSISKGDRGELICVLLWLLARDKTVERQGKRVVKVLDLMDNLLNRNWHESVQNARPSCLEEAAGDVPFREAFKDAITHFTQFIKVHDRKVINRAFLWMALARGAAIMCTNNQGGLDILIPFAMRDAALGRNIVSAIIIQVKNDASYGANPFHVLFDLMNPYRIGFYDNDEQDTHPIIRMVFSLGAKTPNVKVMPMAERKQPDRTVKLEAVATARQPPNFTSYDIWCAKASCETFSVIKSDTTFAKLLKKEKTFPRSYQSSVPGEEEARRQMHPMALTDPVHWQFATTDAPATAKDVPDYADPDVDQDEE